MIYDLELKSAITAQFSGQSVINYLTDRFTYKSYDDWLKIIESGNITIDGEKTSKNSILQENSIICFKFPNYYEPDLDCKFQTIFENENIIVVSKPANLPISSNHRFFKQNMTALLREYKNLPEINPIHRLDRETSGLLIYLKKKFNKPNKLRKDPRLIMVDKYYLAVVKGEVNQKHFSIDKPLKDSNIPPIGYKVIEATEKDGKSASTEFYTLDISNGYTLLLAKLNSGRKHQIRVHCSLAGFPIVGDKLYSNEGKYYIKRSNNEELTENDYEVLGSKHHLLHAYSLNLELPSEGHINLISNYFSDEYSRYLKYFNTNILKKAEEIVRMGDW